MKKNLSLAAACSILLLPAAFAADVNWINSTEPSSWFTPENWSPAAVPTDVDTVWLGEGTAQVTAPDAVADDLILGNGGALEISGTGSLTASFLFAGVNEITSSVTVSGGATMTTGPGEISAAIGGFMFGGPVPGAGKGVVTVTGAGSQWVAGSEVQVGADSGGDAGDGTLNVLAGGKVVIGDFESESPEDSSRLFVGVGLNADTTGQVTVSGAGSKLTSYLIVTGQYEFPASFQGSGSLTVADGGLVQSAAVYMGGLDGATSTGHLSIEGTAGSRGVLQAAVVHLNQGTVDFDGGVLQASAVPLSDGFGGMLLDGADGTFATLGAGGAFIDTNGLDAEVALSLTGAGGLTKLGAGKLTLSGDNDFTGGITVEAGELALGNDAAYGTGNALTVNGGSIGFNGLSYTTPALNGTGGTVNLDNVTLTLDSAANSEFKGVIAGEFGVVVKSGNGEAIFSGANTYTGGTRITGGAFVAGHNTALGTGTITLNGGSLRGMDGIDVANAIFVDAGGGQINNYGAFAQTTFSGAISLGGDVTIGAFSETPASTTVNGGITGTGAVAFFTPEQANLMISGAAVNPTGAISHYGDGAGATIVSAEIGANVTSLTQEGESALILSGTSASYGGTLAVKKGTLKITGALTSGKNDVFGGVTEISNGTLAVDGGSLTQENGGLYVGSAATDNGALEIKNGGSVSNAYAYIGLTAGSTGTVTVTGSGSSWTSANSLSVGYAGTGALTVSAGGHVSSAGAYIGYDSASLGAATVTGGGSWENTGDFYVGNEGSGTLTIADGGVVIAGASGTGTVVVASVGGVTGTIDIGSHDLLNPTTAGTLSAAAVNFGSGTGTINFNQTGATSLSASISGAGSVVQRGSGTTTLAGTSSYSGATTISAGKLLVNGTLAASTITVQNGGTLGGTGSFFHATVENGGMLAPGNSLGTLSGTSLIWNGGAHFVFELGATGSDLLDLTGAFTKGMAGAYIFDFTDGGWQEGQTYTLVDFGSTTFTDSDFSFGNTGPFQGTFAINGNSLQFTLVAVPEPSTGGLVGLGMLAAAVLARGRKKLVR